MPTAAKTDGCGPPPLLLLPVLWIAVAGPAGAAVASAASPLGAGLGEAAAGLGVIPAAANTDGGGPRVGVAGLADAAVATGAGVGLLGEGGVGIAYGGVGGVGAGDPGVGGIERRLSSSSSSAGSPPAAAARSRVRRAFFSLIVSLGGIFFGGCSLFAPPHPPKGETIATSYCTVCLGKAKSLGFL
jgi:hypothetical protein